MKEIELPEFSSYEEEVDFWDNFDTTDYMPEDGWEKVETSTKRAVRGAILPDIVTELADLASARGVALETLVNVMLVEAMRKPVVSGQA